MVVVGIFFAFCYWWRMERNCVLITIKPHKRNYCCPVKIMKRFKNDISPDSRYVWYTYEHFLGGKCRIKLKMGNNNHICFFCSHLSKSFYQTAVNPLVKEGL